jgi:N-dimethylarginine dimethylaminohydrolase
MKGIASSVWSSLRRGRASSVSAILKHNFGQRPDRQIAGEQHDLMKSTIAAIGPETLLFCPDFADDRSLDGVDTVAIPYGPTSMANVINLGGNELIVNRSNRSVIERLAATEHIVHELDLSEYAKGSGGPNCLIMPVDRG